MVARNTSLEEMQDHRVPYYAVRGKKVRHYSHEPSFHLPDNTDSPSDIALFLGDSFVSRVPGYNGIQRARWVVGPQQEMRYAANCGDHVTTLLALLPFERYTFALMSEQHAFSMASDYHATKAALHYSLLFCTTDASEKGTVKYSHYDLFQGRESIQLMAAFSQLGPLENVDYTEVFRVIREAVKKDVSIVSGMSRSRVLKNTDSEGLLIERISAKDLAKLRGI